MDEEQHYEKKYEKKMKIVTCLFVCTYVLVLLVVRNIKRTETSRASRTREKCIRKKKKNNTQKKASTERTREGNIQGKTNLTKTIEKKTFKFHSDVTF